MSVRIPLESIDRVAMLDQAADLIDAVVESLDLREQSCSSCGLTRKNNLNEYRAAEELMAAMKRLEKWSDHFSNNDGEHRKRGK